jgi:thiol-disulfide isomerase/thioredoxin
MNLKSLPRLGIISLVIGVSIFSSLNFASSSPPETYEKTSFEDLGTSPDFISKTIDGKPVKLSDFHGNVIFVNFWATWCGPCRKEIPDFISLQNEYNGKLTIIGVSVDDSSVPVKKFAEKNGINYPIVMNDSTISLIYGPIKGIPTTYIIDKDFKIRKKIVGLKSHEEFKSIIEQLL